MKKYLSILALAAMVLFTAVFTGCKHDVYDGNYYCTQYITEVSKAEHDTAFGGTLLQFQSYVKTWPTKTGYVKKAKLKDYELLNYLDSLATWSNGAQYIIDKCDENSYSVASIQHVDENNQFMYYSIIYIEVVE